MPVVIRRTQTTSDDIASATLVAVECERIFARRAIGSPGIGSAIIRRMMYGSPVDYTKAYIRYEEGTGTPPYTAGYKVFATSFGTPPALSLQSMAMSVKAGSPPYFYAERVRPGSFSWLGSPAIRVKYIAFGFR